MEQSSEPLLSLRGWSLDRQTAQGVAPVLQDLDLDIWPGQWLAVVGANGSGKSSLLKYLASEESPLADQAAIMFQDPDEQIFASGVDREITLGHPERDPGAVRAEFGLAGVGTLNPRLLSAGQKQRLVLAVALGDEPTVLLCDEPTSLQDERQARWVLDRLDQWRRQSGGALVTATCDRREAARSDVMIVLAAGRILRQGPTADLLGDERVAALLGTGEPAEPPVPVRSREAGSPVLNLSGVVCEFPDDRSLPPVDLALTEGDRCGLVGPNGCGKSTLLAVCAGARRPERGTVAIGGQQLYAGSGLDLDHGAALLAPQFPEYLFTRSTVAAEMAVDPRLAGYAPADFLGRLGLPDGLGLRNPHDLSSGQRRRLALGLVLFSGRSLILLDEPTAALDRAGCEMVLALLAELPAATALVIASHDRDFLAAAGCRLLKLTTGD